MPQKTRFHGYRIEELVGMNLLWTTYLAEGYEKLYGSKVILRIPTTFFIKNIKESNAFYDLVIRAGTLNMPEFPQLLDRCILEGKVYFAFEYLEKFKCIAALAIGQRQIEYKEALTIVRNVAVGLSKAWSSNLLLHKNLIPSNIFTDENYNIKVKNLGIYDFLLKDYSLIKNGFNVWDYRYMSPEFIRFGKADSPLCDIYSLGAVLFMLLTGRHPYDGLDFDMIPDAPIPNILDFEPDCPAEIAKIVNIMMEKSEQMRISDWEELIHRIDRIILNMPQHTPTLTNIKVDFKRDIIEPVGLKPAKYTSKRKVFVVDKKQDKKDVTNTLARIVRKKLNTDKLQIEKKDTVWNFLKKKLSPGLIFVFIIGVLLISFFIFFSFNNISNKNLIEQGKVSTKNYNVKKESEPAVISDDQLKTPEKGENEDILSQKRIFSPYEIEEQKIYKLINDAKKIVAKTSPDAIDIDNAINLMHKAKEKARSIKNYKLEQTIINEILDLEGKKREPIEKVIEELKAKVKEFTVKGDFEGALSLIKSYKGPYEEETIQERNYIADEIIRNREEIRKKNEVQRKAAFKKFFEIFKENSGSIIRGDFSEFKNSITNLIESDLSAIKDYVNSIIEQIDIYIKIPQLLNDYIIKNSSSSFEIKFIGSPVEKIKKAEIKDGFLFFLRDNAISSSLEQINLDRIDPDFILEKILNIQSDTKENIFLRALVYLKAGEYKKALENFKLIECFSDYNESFLQKLISEYAVEKEFIEILRDCGLGSVTVNDISNPQLISDIIKLEIKQDDVEKLFSRIQNYKIANSGKAAYSKLERLVEELENQCMRFDKQNKLYRQIVLRTSNKTPGDALIQELHNVKPKTIIKLPAGKYNSSGKINTIFISQKDLSIVGENGVYIDMNLELTSQNIELSDLIFTGDTVILKKDAKNLTIKNCLFSKAIITIERAEDIRFNNCFFRELFIINSKNLYFDHCTLTTVKKSKTDIPLKIEGDSSVEFDNTIVFGESYAMLISEKVLPDKVKFNNSLLFGEDGIAVVKDKDGNIEKKTAIKKEIKLHRLCKHKNGIFEEPKFIDPVNGNWMLVPETPGTKAAKDGRDVGVLWEIFGKNFLLPQ